MKKIAILLSVIMLLMTVFPAFAEAPAGEAPEGAEASDGDSAGDSAGEAAGEQGDDASAGDSAGETAADEEESAGSVGEQGAAEEVAASTDTEPYTAPIDYKVVEADEATGQVRLTYLEVTPILDIDGLKFKDMNKNGELDPYEDWRLETDERIADLISQMTLQEEVGLLFQTQTNGNSNQPAFTNDLLFKMECPFTIDEGGEKFYSVSYFVNEFKINSFLDNSNGTVSEMVVRHNAIQMVAEDTRLGVPATLSCDREYNLWGGYMDIARSAFGASNDTDLTTALWAHYGAAMKSIGYSVTLNPTAAQLTSSNGEDPIRVAEKAALEIQSVQSDGIATCAKHYIYGGYGYGMGKDRSDSDTSPFVNQAYTWKAAVDAGVQWIMNNYGSGISGKCLVDYDAETMRYLRETLGFEGVVMTDGWTLGQGGDLSGNILEDGRDLNTLTLPERYNVLLENGVDLYLGITVGHGTEFDNSLRFPNFPDAIIAGVESSIIDKALVDRAATRLLRTKFNQGQFENPYADLDEALAMNCSPEYIADPWVITNTDELNRARRQDIVEMENQLQASSAVLVRNDDLLPLAEGVKVYFTSTSADNGGKYSAALAEYAVLIDNIEEADVVVADAESMNDDVELIIEDAQDAGKPIVLVCNTASPTAYALENADAVLWLTYSNTPDHGTAQVGDYLYPTQPQNFAGLLFGKLEPQGVVTNEIARSSSDDAWAEIAGDAGASRYVRMLMLALTKSSEDYSVPNNFGDALLPADFSMHYGEKGEFVYDTLYLPRMSVEVTTESNGSTSTSVQSSRAAGIGQPFMVYVLLWNNGADDVESVKIYDGDTLLAEKLYAVEGGSWRVVEMEITLDQPGEHIIRVGDLTQTLNIAE